MDRKRYPKNWNAIALEVKSEANWQCQDCGKPCRRPQQSRDDFEEWLAENFPDWGAEMSFRSINPAIGTETRHNSCPKKG